MLETSTVQTVNLQINKDWTPDHFYNSLGLEQMEKEDLQFTKSDKGWGKKLSEKVRQICQNLQYSNDFQVCELRKDGVMFDPMINKSLSILCEYPRDGAVIIHEDDCIECIRKAGLDKSKCLLLNYANAVHPGGGWESGCTAQEESLFYRSNYHQVLEAAQGAIKRRGLLRNGKFLPLNRAVITPNVFVWGISERNAQNQQTIKLINEEGSYFLLPMIAAAATDYQDISYCPSEKTIRRDMNLLWETIFQSAICMDIHHFFIGPIGCGAFAPKACSTRYRIIVADVTTKLIQKYRKYFQAIHFVDVPYSKNTQIFRDAMKQNVHDPSALIEG
jgi:uncharacterized protein (TIGR02452 family)